MLRIMRRIAGYSKPYSGYLAAAVVTAAVGSVLSLFVPVLIGNAVDLIVGKNSVDFNGLARIALILSIIVLISAVCQWIMGICSNNLAYKTIRDIRCQLFEKLNTVPVEYIDKNPKGDLINRAVNDAEILSDGLVQLFAQLFTGVVTIVGTLCFMFTINVKIALLVIVLTPLSILLASRVTVMSKSAFAKQSQLRGELLSLSEEMVGNQKVVKAFSYEKRAEEKFAKINEDMRKIGTKATFYASISNPGTRFVNSLIYAAVGLSGSIAAINGILSVGQLTSFLTYANQYTKPFNEISGVVAELQNAVASAERIFNVLDEPSEPSDEHLPELKNCSGSLTMQNVYFSYSPDRKLIADFNLNVKPGQKIAIVGPTGCGKTTVINLLLRFYEINSGLILLSDTNTREITRNSLRTSFGMVLQDTWLFSGTIADNIAYGKPDATRDEIIQAAKSVYAHGFIKRLPAGYDTVISEAGGSLSQGQKQLISIARIMLVNPPMLILDEATSSIDVRTEQKIQKAFEKIMQNKTSFIIAHRLSTIQNADLILVMNNGNIVEKGTHAQLLDENGFYANLYKSQFASV